MIERFDFAVLGSGFGGSILSMVLRRLGFSVLLLEKGRHPRFVIGESSTPFSNLLLETIATEFDLPMLRPLCEWGSWQRSFPNLPCGLKRGFTFYHHRAGERFHGGDQQRRLLVGASANDLTADTHWYRPAVDAFLAGEASSSGVMYLDRARVESLRQTSEGWHLGVRTSTSENEFAAGMLVDATGAASELANHLQIGKAGFPGLPSTCALYAHFKNVREWDDSDCSSLPFPPKAAAVHHVFDGGWIWILRFNNGIVSAGAALEARKRASLDPLPALAWDELLQELPSVQEIFSNSVPVTPFYETKPLSFRRAAASGENWALLPSAAGFVDPLLSTGFALNLLGILRLARAFRERSWHARWKEYGECTLSELDGAGDLVGALYSKMDQPEQFNLISLIYFAALSFTEAAWRLGKPEMATEFLLNNNPEFRTKRRELCAAARGGSMISRDQIAALIEPWNIAGLARWERANVYPLSMEDLYASAGKLGVDGEEITQMLIRCGLV